MPRKWEDALDALTDNYKFWKSELGERYGKGFLSDREHKLIDGVYGEERTRLAKEQAEDVARKMGLDLDKQAQIEALDVIEHEALDVYTNLHLRMSHMLFNSDPIWIEPDMWKLVLAASQSWSGEALAPSDLPTMAGFMLLPEPMTSLDVWRKKVSIRAINWHPMRYTIRNPDNGETVRYEDGILIAFYHRTSDPDDYTQERESSTAPWLLSHCIPWAFGVHDATGPKYTGYDIGMTLQVAWRLMQQQVALSGEYVASRPFVKRAQKVELPEKRVTVVTLRRPKQDTEYAGTRTVEWTRQWINSGHWRNQYYPVADTHRLIWIGPYVKGPPDKPLILKKVRAFQWTR